MKRRPAVSSPPRIPETVPARPSVPPFRPHRRRYGRAGRGVHAAGHVRPVQGASRKRAPCLKVVSERTNKGTYSPSAICQGQKAGEGVETMPDLGICHLTPLKSPANHESVLISVDERVILSRMSARGSLPSTSIPRDELQPDLFVDGLERRIVTHAAP